MAKENLGRPTVDSSCSTEEEVLKQWLKVKSQESKIEGEQDTCIDRTAEQQDDETKKVHEDTESS